MPADMPRDESGLFPALDEPAGASGGFTVEREKGEQALKKSE